MEQNFNEHKVSPLSPEIMDLILKNSDKVVTGNVSAPLIVKDEIDKDFLVAEVKMEHEDLLETAVMANKIMDIPEAMVMQNKIMSTIPVVKTEPEWDLYKGKHVPRSTFTYQQTFEAKPALTVQLERLKFCEKERSQDVCFEQIQIPAKSEPQETLTDIDYQEWKLKNEEVDIKNEDLTQDKIECNVANQKTNKNLELALNQEIKDDLSDYPCSSIIYDTNEDLDVSPSAISSSLEVPTGSSDSTEFCVADSGRLPLTINEYLTSEVPKSSGKKRIWDKRDFCLYCYQNVTNFSRHLMRKHKSQTAVHKFMNMEVGSIRRKNFIDKLRKKGNFLSPAHKEIKLVRRPTENVNPGNTVACVYCKGYYIKSYIKIHHRNCKQRSDNRVENCNAQDSQTDLAFRCIDNVFVNQLHIKKGILKLRCDSISQGIDEIQKAKDIKTLETLTKSNWTAEVTSVANQNLMESQWEKPTIIPLTSDVHKLNRFVQEKAISSCEKLKANPNDRKSFNELQKCCYTLLITVNGHRIGELERLEAESYLQENNTILSEEFQEHLTEAEKMLLKKYKRIFIRGKHHKPVPVLISSEVQNYITNLLLTRKNFVSPTNSYLFVTLNKHTCLDGYLTLRNFAKASGAEYPEALISNKLRKHIATISQIHNLDTCELEQLCTFLGYTMTAYQNFYRLPEEVYQTAKLAKYLLKLQNKASNVDDMDENLLSDDSADGEVVDDKTSNNAAEIYWPAVTRIKWTDGQKEITKQYFKSHIRRKKAPTQSEIEVFKNLYPIMENKDWKKIKVCQTNQKNNLKKRHLKYKKPRKVETLRCNECEFRTHYRSKLKVHHLQHKNPEEVELFKCDKCAHQTRYKGNLKQHQHFKHKNPEEVDLFQCNECEYKTSRKTLLRQHVLKHKNPEEVDLFLCDKCPFQTCYKNSLRSHVLNHKSPILRCDKCAFESRYRHALKRHHYLKHEYHGEEDLLRCDKCKYQTYSKGSLTRHYLTHKNPEESFFFGCEKCEFRTRYKSYITRHQLSHKNSTEVDFFRCDKCEYQTRFKSNLKSHLLKHKKPEEVAIFRCDKCEYRTRYRNALKGHLLKHKSNLDEVDLFKCNECSFQTRYKYALLRHFLKHGNTAAVGLLKCDRCEYLTCNKINFNKHHLSHKNPEDVNFFACDKCEYRTFQKRKLQKHLLNHRNPEEVDIFRCDKCEFQTRFKSSLKRHVVLHKNLKFFRIEN